MSSVKWRLICLGPNVLTVLGELITLIFEKLMKVSEQNQTQYAFLTRPAVCIDVNKIDI